MSNFMSHDKPKTTILHRPKMTKSQLASAIVKDDNFIIVFMGIHRNLSGGGKRDSQGMRWAYDHVT